MSPEIGNRIQIFLIVLYITHSNSFQVSNDYNPLASLN